MDFKMFTVKDIYELCQGNCLKNIVKRSCEMDTIASTLDYLTQAFYGIRLYASNCLGYLRFIRRQINDSVLHDLSL